MDLSTILKTDAIRVQASASSKKQLMHAIGDLVQGAYGLPASATVEALMDREILGPTGVGNGIALPHARMAQAGSVVGAFVLLQKPLEFNSVDRQPVDMAFALIAPEDAGVEHLKALALVSRTLRDQHLCAKLRANPDPTTLYTILTEAQSVQAA